MVRCLSVFQSHITEAPLRRSPQARKHKTWEGDGVLVVNSSRATLMDQDGRVYALLYHTRLDADSLAALVQGRLARKIWKRAHS